MFHSCTCAEESYTVVRIASKQVTFHKSCCFRLKGLATAASTSIQVYHVICTVHILVQVKVVVLICVAVNSRSFVYCKRSHKLFATLYNGCHTSHVDLLQLDVADLE